MTDAGYANGYQLRMLGQLVDTLDTTARDTGWRFSTAIVSTGEGEEEITVGLRWIDGPQRAGGHYVAEIR